MATGVIGGGMKPGLPNEGFDGLKGPMSPGGIKGPSTGLSDPTKVAADTAEFKRALGEAAAMTRPAGSVAGTAAGSAIGSTASPNALEKLKFSNHAIERMRSRGIAFPPEQMRDIEGAVTKAAAKGSKDTLVLAGDNALIVSVKNKTVVTVMDRATMKDNVFTNIDSTVVV